MTNQIMELRVLALALWNAHGNVGVALQLPDETARLLILAGYDQMGQILISPRRKLRSCFHLKPDSHLKSVEDALARFGLTLEMAPSEVTEILNALILPSEVVAKL